MLYTSSYQFYFFNQSDKFGGNFLLIQMLLEGKNRDKN